MTSRVAGLFGGPDSNDWDTGNPELDELIWQIWLLYSEVHNGGFWQYFYNGSGEGVTVVCEALKEIDAENARAIVEAAISAVGTDVPWENEEKRQEILLALPRAAKDRLWEFGSQFSRHIDDLPVLLYCYMQNHRDEFDAPAGFWEESK